MTRPRAGAGARLAAVASTDDPVTELVALAAPFPAVTPESIRLPSDMRPGGVFPETLYSWLLQAAETRPALRIRLARWVEQYPQQAAAWAPVAEEPWLAGPCHNVDTADAAIAYL